MNNNLLLLLLAFTYIITSCVSPEENIIPKPKNYFRIDLPDKEYNSHMDDCPFSFETPVYSKILKLVEDPCYKVLDFACFKAKVLCTYNRIDTSFSMLTEKVKSNAYKHSFKANSINELEFTNSTSSVYGISYEITGNAACNYMFYLTDSSQHFFTGELLFDVRPNYDSLQPIIEFIKTDIQHLIESFKWKKL